MLENRAERNKLRQAIMNAEDKKVMSRDEVGFVVTLVERFVSDIDKKTKQLYMIQGEIAQLKLNERIIIQLIDNIVAAAEREEARRETMSKLRGGMEVEDEIEDESEGEIEE